MGATSRTGAQNAKRKLHPRKETYFSEIYVKHPDTLEEGWEIKIDYVKGWSREQAKEKVRQHYGNLFDTFILFYETSSLNKPTIK